MASIRESSSVTRPESSRSPALEPRAALARHGELEPPVGELLGGLALRAHGGLVLGGALGEAAGQLVGELAGGAGGGAVLLDLRPRGSGALGGRPRASWWTCARSETELASWASSRPRSAVVEESSAVRRAISPFAAAASSRAEASGRLGLGARHRPQRRAGPRARPSHPRARGCVACARGRPTRSIVAVPTRTRPSGSADDAVARDVGERRRALVGAHRRGSVLDHAHTRREAPRAVHGRRPRRAGAR